MGVASRRSNASQVSCDVFAGDTARVCRCCSSSEAETDMVARTTCTKLHHQDLMSDPTRLAAEGKFTGYFFTKRFMWAEIICPHCSQTLSLKLKRIGDAK